MNDTQQPEALRSLYEITGNVADANTVLVNRAELRRLHQVDLAYQEWIDKTEWVQASSQASELGQHRADVIKQRLDLVTGQRDELLEALKAAKQLFDEALPKFNWGASALDSKAIGLLNEVPRVVQAAIAKAGGAV